MTDIQANYDIVIIGSGHNGLVAANYLSRAGHSVLVLEGNNELGGATRSKQVFSGQPARLSVYSYLVSLLPQKIIDDLGLKLSLRSRKTASWTPSLENGQYRELLLRNNDPEQNRAAIEDLTGSSRDYDGYVQLQQLQEQLAAAVWPSFLEPLLSRSALRGHLGHAGTQAWQAFIEQPLGMILEQLIDHDLLRGVLLTDARIGLQTHAHDASLLQNRCFLYHIVGNGTGEWRVPVGGMQSLVDQLIDGCRATGRVNLLGGAPAQRLSLGEKVHSVAFQHEDKEYEVEAKHVLCNASRQVLDDLLGRDSSYDPILEGTGFKINMLLRRLPRLKESKHSAGEAFAGTVHIDEGYSHMQTCFEQSDSGVMPAMPPGEIYCHTLTDDSILSDDLIAQGYHTITLFGLDMPYKLFVDDPEDSREEAVRRYLRGLNQFLEEPIEECLAFDADGKPCLEAMSAYDLETKLRLPRGNIFHGDLSWPFAESDAAVGTWGVETEHRRVLLCGSAAARGGAVSGVPGHNAAMKVLEAKA
ncbi:MAG: NAD(P)/FAD-dependent oxidoreductase [Planctomycetota bacterium]|nr:NAD(P)/FAD-dependent oxidoreductase [Planctomycetota bacterium]